MAPRLTIQSILESITPNVYFQPPANVQIEYPCIVYERSYALTDYAGNIPYRYEKRYQVTVIDRDPDSEIPDKVAALPTSSFNRFFKAENLNHDVFNVYF